MRVVYEGRLMCVRMRCQTIAQLAVALHPFVRGTSLFVTTARPPDTATDVPFVVTLHDGTVAIQGRAVVRHAWASADNVFRRPGVLLAICALTESSRIVLEQVLRASPPPPPIPVRDAVRRRTPSVEQDDEITAKTPIPRLRPDRDAAEDDMCEVPTGRVQRPVEAIETTERVIAPSSNPLVALTDAAIDGYVDAAFGNVG